MIRKCGECTLCCSVMPVSEIKKNAGEKCAHVRRNGCNIYATRPASCKVWTCAWLIDTSIITRPDRSHFVIDPSHDYVTLENDPHKTKYPVLQIWVDPKYPNAHELHELRVWLDKFRLIGLIRFHCNFSSLAHINGAMGTTQWDL